MFHVIVYMMCLGRLVCGVKNWRDHLQYFHFRVQAFEIFALRREGGTAFAPDNQPMVQVRLAGFFVFARGLGKGAWLLFVEAPPEHVLPQVSAEIAIFDKQRAVAEIVSEACAHILSWTI